MYKETLFIDGTRKTLLACEYAITYYKTEFPQMELTSRRLWDFKGSDTITMQLNFTNLNAVKLLDLPTTQILAINDDRLCLSAYKSHDDIVPATPIKDQPARCPLIKIELGEKIINEVSAWWERLYPADIFVGSCDDEGSETVTRIRQLLEQYNREGENV